MTTKIGERQLRSIVKESVREALGTEMMKLRALLVPYVSDREQKEIEKRFKKPSRSTRNGFVRI